MIVLIGTVNHCIDHKNQESESNRTQSEALVHLTTLSLMLARRSTSTLGYHLPLPDAPCLHGYMIGPPRSHSDTLSQHRRRSGWHHAYLPPHFRTVSWGTPPPYTTSALSTFRFSSGSMPSMCSRWLHGSSYTAGTSKM